jgi:hypothetical protein
VQRTSGEDIPSYRGSAAFPGPTHRYFFERLYAGLGPGADLRDAFRAALQQTREHSPDDSAWAQFYLLGDWRSTAR